MFLCKGEDTMGKRRKRFRPPIWFRRIREILAQVLVPLIIFQFIRTLILPTTFDVILLTVLVIIYGLLLFGII